MEHDATPDATPAAAAAEQPAARPRGRRALLAGGTVTVLAGGLLAAVVVPGLHGEASTVPGPVPPAPTGGSARVQDVAYSTFTDCSALLGYYRSHARPLVGPYGLPGSGGPWIYAARGGGVAVPMAAGDKAAAGSGAPAGQEGTTSQTGTNVQVAGVDEADLAKRVGDLVYSAAWSDVVSRTDTDGTRQPALTVARTAGGKATLVGRLPLAGWQPQNLLVEGRTVLLVGSTPFEGGRVVPDGKIAVDRMPWGWQVAKTRIVQVDVTDPAAPKVVRTLDVDGSQVGVRLVDGVARVTVSGATNRIRFVQPRYPDPSNPAKGATDPGPVVAPPYDEAATKKAEKLSTAANRALVAKAGIDDWLPRYSLTEGAGSKPTSSGTLLSCDEIAAPTTFSGLDTMSMLTFDLRDAAGISRWNGTGLVASGAILYATADRTYVSTTPWQDWSLYSPAEQLRRMQAQRSRIFAFDTTGGASPVYAGSGEVPGFLLNQFAMDERDGYLRVASTSAPDWWTGDRSTPSTSQVTVLKVGPSGLTRAGAVGGLGKGEQIRAVRFLGDAGYVVTYRQTDPLYTLDLSDPAAPKVAGELKILGYSAYLHPVGDGLLLGVGQDATAKGLVQGLQMSLFDVSDPAAPKRLDQVTLPGAWSDVEGDHHAFTFADGLALVPYVRWGDPAPVEDGSTSGVGSGGTLVPQQPSFDAGVVAVRVTGSGADSRFSAPSVLRAVGSGPVAVGNDGRTPPQPLRTFVGDGSVWTVTTGGIAAHDAKSLDRSGFTPF